jgi:DNA-damage-inducible protein J
MKYKGVDNMAEYTANINIRTDKTTKKLAEDLFKDLGMNLSTAINLFLRQSIRNRALPFAITKNVPNAETIEALKEAEQILKNPEKYKSYNNMADLKRDLLDD